MKLKFILLFSIILLGTALQAANVNVTTYYGKTGGIVGKLNTIGDKVNGRFICPSNPTDGCDFSSEAGFNNNGTVDDPSDDSYSGDLLVRTNDIFQVITGWNWNNTSGDGEDTVIVTGTLPEKDGKSYYEWTELPGTCSLDGSSISEDKQTIICKRKAFDKDEVKTKAEDLTFNVRVLGGTPNGAKPGDISFQIESKNATTKDDDTDNNSLTVTASPRWNLQKSMYTTWAGKEYDIDNDGTAEKGWIMDYKFYIESDEVVGETDDVNPIVGNESMGKDATFTFTDDMSGLPPHATLIGCSMNGRYDLKDGYVGGGDPITFNGAGSIYGAGVNIDRKIPQTKGEQQITCTPSANQIAIKVEHVDATLDHYPTKNYSGNDLPVNRAIAAIGSIYIFIPVEDVQKGKNDTDDGCTVTDPNCDDGEYGTVNKLINFDPETPTHNSNFGADSESEKDNSYGRTLYYAAGSWSKRYRGGGYTSYNGDDGLDYIYGWQGTDDRSGDGMVTKGAEFSTWLVTSNTGGTAFTEDTSCDVIDAYRLKIQPVKDNIKYTNIGNRYTGGVDLPYRYYIWNDSDTYTDGMDHDANNLNNDPLPYIIEYATDYVDSSFLPSQGGDTTAFHSEDIERECTDASVNWTTDFEQAMRGPIGVTKVRLRLKSGIEVPSGSGIYFWINHKIRDIDLATNQTMHNGDLIVNYAGHKFNYGEWYWPDYKPGVFPGNHSGWNGDRVMFTGPKVRIKKLVNRNTASPGSEIIYTLETSFTDDINSKGNSGDVKVTDVLPKDFNYVKGTTLPVAFGEPQEGHCNDVIDLGVTCIDGENQVLIWDYGTRPVNAPEITDLNFTVQVGASARVGVNVNHVKIESSEDASPISQRHSDASVSIDVPATINIVKSTEDNPDYPVKRERTTVDKDIWFLMDLRNGTANSLTDLDVIDILPFKGDGDDKAILFNDIKLKRKIPTYYHGSMKFHKASFNQHPNSDTVCNDGAIQYFYTNANPKTINMAPTVGSANDVTSNDSIWCEGDESGPNGCNGLENTEVTAIRVKGIDMEGQAICQFKVKVTVKDNLAGDNYSNSAGASATGVTLPVLSNSLAVPIVGSSLGDVVWYDKNIDGIQDADELGVAGITVALLDENGNPVPNPANPNADYIVTTDVDGKYLFSKLNSGRYKIKFTLPEKFVGTQKGVGGNSNTDSNIGSNGMTGIIDLGVEENDLSIDAGIYALVTLGDSVWYDNNKDGIQDNTESGVNGVKVSLYDTHGVIVKTTITDEHGSYLFKDVIPGDYTVGFTDLPPAYGISPKDVGNDATDSDVNQVTGKTEVIHVNTPDDILTIDMGIYKNDLAVLGDTVWYDDNKDGKQDATERGVNGVKVTLFDNNGVEVTSTVTDAQGTYLFRDVVPATYTVGFSDLPTAYKISPKDATVDSRDSDVDPTTGKTDPITLAVGDNNLDIDMGIYNDKLATLGDTVWYDDNKDGIQDTTETGVEGVEVTLLDTTGTIVATTVTSETGTYLFRDLIPGSYVVEFTNLPAAYVITKKDTTGDSRDSDVNPVTGKTDSITLAVGENNLDADMGIYNDELASVGDTVWYDDNKDGKQDATEKGVNGVKVTLFDSAGNEVASTVTDAQGNYLFRDVVPATYTVGFTDLPAAYVISPKQNDSKADATGKTDPITLVVGENNLDVDMGIYNNELATLGDTVWYDDNKDGKQDATEKGVNGVKVTLYKGTDIVATTVTDAQGNYLFRDLVPATYTVGFTDLPATYVISPKDTTTDSLDSDVEPSTGKTDSITLAVGENNLDADMGIYNDALATLGDTVWYDDNKDGKQDATEKGVNGVKVTLYKGTDIVATTVTDAQGNYLFRDVVPATYTVGFTDLPATYVISPKDTTTDSLDSDVEPSTGKTADIVLAVGENNLDADMGIYNDKLATLGDTVWYDDNKDGKQDISEKGVNGVKVTLFDSAGNEVSLTVTDEQGNYLFRDVIPATYTIGFTDLPATYVISPKDTTTDSLDSDVEPSTGKTADIVLAVGENNLDADMGIYNDELASLGDTVWYDDNKDGKQDATEKGVNGVKVTLYKGTDIVATTVTDAQGNYLFRDLLPATYTVGFTDLPAAYVISPKDTTTDSLDSDVDPTTGKTADIVLAVGENNLDADMGIYNDKLATLGDTVWYDDNKDGKQDVTEKGVNGVKVTLFDSAGNEVASTVTDEQGNYLFRDVIPATYTIGFTDLPATYVISPKDTTTDSLDSDVEPATGRTADIILAVGDNNLDADMGIYNDKLATLGDTVWYDDNKDGKQDATEKGVNGVKVTLYKGTDIVATTVTDAQGNYLFRDVVPATYTVGFTDLPATYVISPKDTTTDSLDSDVEPSTGKTADIVLAVGENNLDADMGIYNDELATLGDTVWYDDNKDGKQDATEKGVNGVKVTLYNRVGNEVASTVTDEQGNYLFRDLVAGDYSVEFTDLPATYVISPQQNDSKADTTGKTDPITLAVGENNLNVDMGIYNDELATLGDTVWYDDNKDGKQDATEKGVNGVKVTLYNGTDIVATTVTDAQGNYLFRDLVAGDYTVGFTDLPAAYVISPKDKTSDSLDSDVEPSTGKTGTITLAVGDNNLDADMGIYNDKLATLGDTVWYDDNKDGKQDATEKGVNGVKVTLFDSAGKEVASTVTDEQGNYLFRDVIPAIYTVGFTDLPSAYKISPKENDSKADQISGKTDPITLGVGENNLDADMGIYNDKLATLGDTVWYDDNRNGMQDLEEKGVSGVKVTLFDSNDVEVTSTVTDEQGNYLFRDLVPADYKVGFTNLPASYVISPKNKGIDDAKDSDADEISGKTDSITLKVGENNLDTDMGIYTKRFVTIGDAVWYDDNRDGVQDDDEKGVEAVKVILFDSAGEVVATTTTDRNGIYQFRNVRPGVYSLGFTDLPVDYLISPKAGDSVVNAQTGKTVTFEVKEGDIDLSFDMGIYTNSLGTIGDAVWYDDNRDGIQDITERGVEAIKVTLFDENGVTVATTTTDRNGNYQFRDLSVGTYTVGFSDLPVGYLVSPKDIGDDSNNSDVNVVTKRTDSIVLSEGSHDLTVDMGIYRENRAIIGNSVWYDDNRNGIQDVTEKGAEAVKVELFSSDGTLVATTTTDEDGHYQFRNLVAGNYYVKVSDLPVGYEITKQNEGSEETDSDVDAFGKTATIDLKEGDVVTNVDMGIFNRQRATIGSHVWYDENRNGLQDSFEKGVEAVKVTLYDESNNLVSTTTTDRNGLYQFRDLLPESYHVGFSELPVGYEITLQNAEGDSRDSEDSDADEAGNTVVTILSEGENDVTWDMGIYNSKRASIGDVVWYDDNKDGIQGANEFGVDAVKVTLYRGDGTVVSTTVTDSKGNYKFGNLLPDNYYVEFSDLPVGYRATVANTGSDYKDSDADVSTLRTETTRLEAGENDLSWDMGIHNELRASIGNTVWYDDNKNGQQDAYEFGASAVKATLYTQSGAKVAETLTDERGNYAFRNLLPDTYYVEFSELPSSYEVSPQNSGTDTKKDSDVNPSTLRTGMISVEAGENDLSWDMGLFNKERASLGNKVWFDDNHDGLQDITEKGVSAVKVTLFDKDNNIVKTTRTNEYGEYIFRDLVPAEYYVGFSEFPATYMITKQNVSDDWKEDSDANYHRGQTIHTTLDAGENDLSWDVGLYVPTLVNIGDKVWYDENVNGIQDAGERGVKNVRVTLIKNGIPQIPSEQTTTPTTSILTDENGEYLFENIEAFAPHEYHVIFDQDTLPEDFLITRQNMGEDKTLDSDANPETGETKDVILTSENDLTWDMGIQTLHVYDDTVIANTDGPVTTINVLENDNGDINNQTIKFITTNTGEVLWNNGTAVAGTNTSLADTLVIPGEGVWSVEDGKIIFTAEDGFKGVPTPIYYVVEGDSGQYSNVGQVKFKTPCTCETYTTGSDSVSALNPWSMLFALFFISTLGAFFVRREFEEVK